MLTVNMMYVDSEKMYPRAHVMTHRHRREETAHHGVAAERTEE